MLDMRRKEFGESEAQDFVPGAEVVEGEEDKENEEEEEESDMEEGEEQAVEKDQMTMEEKKVKAREMTLGKILTDEDFRRIDAAQLKKQVRARNRIAQWALNLSGSYMYPLKHTELNLTILISKH